MGRAESETWLRSWIRIDSSGREIVCDADKYAIMRRLEIDGRDLRMLDSALSYPSTILARHKTILLNLEHIRAIITAREVLLCDPSHDNVSPVMEELRRRLDPVNAHQQEEVMFQDELRPFEIRALDVAIEAICTYFDALATELETNFYPALDMLVSKISSSNLDRICKLKNQLTKLTARVQKVRDELQQILDDHDRMISLNLSRKVATSPLHGSDWANWFPVSRSTGSAETSAASRASVAAHRGDENHVGELELLLEAYFMKVEGTLQKLMALREYVDSTQAFINIQLEHRRNQFLQLELFLSTGTLCISLMALVFGLFGVSIKYKWNHGHGYMFKWVIIVTCSFSGLVFLLIMSHARRKGLIGS